MRVKIRNLDEAAYLSFKARAAMDGKTIGEAMNEAIRAYLDARPTRAKNARKQKSDHALLDEAERASEGLDETLRAFRWRGPRRRR